MRRWTGAAVALVLVMMSMTSADQAKAQEAPTITIMPNCDAPAGPGKSAKLSITVEGDNWPPSTTNSSFSFPNSVSVYFASVHQTSANTDAGGHFKTVITPNRPAAGLYLVRVDTANGSSATLPFRLPCPSLAINPNCGPVGARPATYSITVTGHDFYGTPTSTTTERFRGPAFRPDVVVPATGPGSGAPQPRGQSSEDPVTIVFGNGETFTAYLDDTGTFSAVITPARRAASTYSVVATDRHGFGAQSPGGFVVPCPTLPTPTVTQTTGTTATTPSTGTTTTLPPPPVIEPAPAVTLQCDPCVGEPGVVTIVSGSGFQPGENVTLRWEPGVGSAAVTADATGAIRGSLLVFHRDQLGQRKIIADASGGGRGEVPFLAVTPPVKPSARGVQVQGVRRLVRLVQR